MIIIKPTIPIYNPKRECMKCHHWIVIEIMTVKPSFI